MAALLEGVPFRILNLSDFPGVTLPPEGESSYAENALGKARAVAAATGEISLADDSGIEVDALGGGPGVLSARYGGPGLSDPERCEVMLREMAAVPRERRIRALSLPHRHRVPAPPSRDDGRRRGRRCPAGSAARRTAASATIRCSSTRRSGAVSPSSPRRRRTASATAPRRVRSPARGFFPRPDELGGTPPNLTRSELLGNFDPVRRPSRGSLSKCWGSLLAQALLVAWAFSLLTCTRAQR